MSTMSLLCLFIRKRNRSWRSLKVNPLCSYTLTHSILSLFILSLSHLYSPLLIFINTYDARYSSVAVVMQQSACLTNQFFTKHWSKYIGG